MVTYVFATILAVQQAPARDSLLARGIRLAALEPARALVCFEAILAGDSSDVEAGWRAAIARADLAEAFPGPRNQARRDSLLDQAQLSARRAVRLAPADPNALFTLGMVLGWTALERSGKERVRLSAEIRELALRALAADSTHDGAHHLLGRWHYEVRRLSGFQRFIARTFLGGGVLGQASWAAAQRHLERAAALDSTRIYHRLDLAQVLMARKQPAAARAELERLLALPVRVAADSSYRRQAQELLSRLLQ